MESVYKYELADLRAAGWTEELGLITDIEGDPFTASIKIAGSDQSFLLVRGQDSGPFSLTISPDEVAAGSYTFNVKIAEFVGGA